MTYINYVLEKFQAVQRVQNWKGNYSNFNFDKIKNEDFKEAIKKLNENDTLSRDDIFKLFDNKNNTDLYYAFVATMIWGGLGLGQGRSRQYFIQTMEHPKNNIVKILNDANTSLKEGKLEEAFLSFNRKNKKEDKEYRPGNNKIPGIGPSYFTKLLYFLDQRHHNLLIYDKWGMWIHAALSLSDDEKNQEAVRRNFKIKYNRGGYLAVDSGQNWKMYQDYLTKVRTLSNQLKTQPDILEEFLFGDSMRLAANRAETNPRYVLKQYLMKVFPNGSISKQKTLQTKPNEKQSNGSSSSPKKPKSDKTKDIKNERRNVLGPRIQWRSNGKEIVLSKDTAQLIQDRLENNYTIKIILPGQRVIQYTNMNSLKYSALRQIDLGNSLVKMGINKGDCRDITISITENSKSTEMKINISFNS